MNPCQQARVYQYAIAIVVDRVMTAVQKLKHMQETTASYVSRDRTYLEPPSRLPAKPFLICP